MKKKQQFHQDTKSKLKELIIKIDIAMMETNLSTTPPYMVPMSTKEVDAEGCIWFLSNRNSQHNTNLNTNNNVQLIYSNPNDMEFLSIYGNAFITTDKDVLERFYSNMDDTCFNGIQDPDLTAIKVIPITSRYWDSMDEKSVNLLKSGLGTLTEQQQNSGKQDYPNFQSMNLPINH